ncbi:hypothetical protein GCM10027034_25090 [Ramlibacter solisilvae]|uniref:flagellar hook-basal body complex protein FliE n=1 Tax=Ramlibacter tataouinensis TaxID=94132 RepID=UPI0009EE5EFD|nr:flagellar hook-basal body complex protein FliE [Ramlibacter tataouinensis]
MNGGLPPIGAIPPAQVNNLFPEDLVGPQRITGAGTGAPAMFADMVSQGLAQVNEKLQAGQAGLQRLATGDVQNVHQVMIQLEESRLSFQLMMQVRGRLLEAYQDIMKMQI